MASQNKTELPQEQAYYEPPSPPPTPVTGTSPRETTQDQSQRGTEVASSTPAIDVSSSEPRTPEQDTRDESITQPSKAAAIGTSPGAKDTSHDETLAGPSGKGKQKEVTENERPKASDLASSGIQNKAAETIEVPELGPSDTTNDGDYNVLPCEEFRGARHNCDRCGNMIRCSFKRSRPQNDDAEVDDGMEAPNEASEEQPTAQGLVLYLARVIALHFPLFARLLARLLACAGVQTTCGSWTGAADYDRTIMPLGQGWNVGKIEEGNVGGLLKYLRQRTAGDDILEVFLVPMNKQDAQEHGLKTYERAMERKGKGNGGELFHNQLVRTCPPRMVETVFEEQDEEGMSPAKGTYANPAELE